MKSARGWRPGAANQSLENLTCMLNCNYVKLRGNKVVLWLAQQRLESQPLDWTFWAYSV